MNTQLNLGVDDLEDIDTPDYKEFAAGVLVGVALGAVAVAIAT